MRVESPFSTCSMRFFILRRMRRWQARLCAMAAAGALVPACSTPPPPPPPPAAQNLLVVTIDTLRADRLGAYGDAQASTPAIDRLAREGVVFANAFAPAPITLPSHASLMTGRYPPGHGARHNGLRLDLAVPTLADHVAKAGFATGAFVGAFPLDRRFGLIKGFRTYGDKLPRGADGRPANERPGAAVVDDAIGWLGRHSTERFFLWVHMFEPHAPYGDPRTGRPAETRYRDEITEADRQVGRLVAALGARAASTFIVVTSDHGEAFGEHGEISHSVFVYDTTLHVPLIITGPGVPAGGRITAAVNLVDVAPTVVKALGLPTLDADGVDLSPALSGVEPADRVLYAETFAPLLDFGWSPLRAVRHGGWKYIEAPKPELYHVAGDPKETANTASAQSPRATTMRGQVERFSSADIPVTARTDPEASARLQALGYVTGRREAPGAARPDPKDKRELAARIARVTSGELQGTALTAALREILREDPANPQANLRLGFVLLESGRCADAIPHFRGAIDAKVPSADAHLGLAACQAAGRDFTGAATTLRAGERVEPGNPIVLANLGVVLSDGGQPLQALDPLQRALTTDPDLHQARFALAIAFARAGRRAEAARAAEELLRRLPANAPQRPEVERLLRETR